jgi:restriction endonuclease
MKIQFDAQQQYQIQAVDAVVDVFDGQPLAQGQFEIGPAATSGEFLSELGFGNELTLSEEAMLENVRRVQRDNGVEESEELQGMNFSVEMETGTGSPVDAYDLRLVKRIEVDSVLDDPDFNQPYISVNSVTATKSGPRARLEIDVRSRSGPQRKKVTVNKNGQDLFDLSGEREM